MAQIKRTGELQDLSGRITQVQIDNNNKYIATGNDMGILTVWDFSSREEIFKVHPHKGQINYILFNSNEQIITFTDDEIAFTELTDGSQSSRTNIFENINWVDINTSSRELYILASRKQVSGSKRIYFINLASRKFGVSHASVSGVSSFKTSRDGKIMYISKGSDILVKNIELGIIEKKLPQESKIQTMDINPYKPNWLIATDNLTIRYWKISSENKYVMRWNVTPAAEDTDKILKAWILNKDNKILIQGEKGYKIRDVTNPFNEKEVMPFIGLDIRDIKLSPDKATILLQIGKNTLGIYSNGKAVTQSPAKQIAGKSESSLPPSIDSSDDIYTKYKEEINEELNLREELFIPRGEFERSVDYEGRKAEADNYKAGIFKYYKELANREAQVEIELAQARQKILDDQAKRDSERKASLYRDKIVKSYSEFSTKISTLGTYNADTEEFPITIDGITHQINVPFDKAREFKANYSFCKVVGNQQYLEDATTLDKFNYRIITDNKDVYEFGKQKEPLFVEAQDLLFDSIVVGGMKEKTSVAAETTPSRTSNTEKVNSLDDKIIEYFSKKKYYALLIAVNDYNDQTITQLDGPINDALRLKRVLKEKYTFNEENITFLKNPTRTEIIETFDRLQKEIGEEDNLFIFYAGHGIWDERLKQGFWLPSDAKRESKAAWLSNSRIRDYIGGIGTKHTLLVADACFSGGIFKSRSVFSENRASLELAKLPSRKAITSGAMKTVPDKSVFIEYLVKRLDQNEKSLLPAEQLFSLIRIPVMNNSQGQVPQFGDIQGAGDEGGDFVFLKRQ